MSNWFGKKESSSNRFSNFHSFKSNYNSNIDEAARRQQREITKAQRTVQRSTADLERDEKKLEMEIKKLAKQGQVKACQMLAKQLVQLRNQKARTMAANCKIGAVGSQTKVQTCCFVGFSD